MNSGELEQEISKWEASLATVQASHDKNSKRLAELEGERRDQIVPARVEGNVTSQEELRRLDAEMATVSRDVQDDAHAIREIEQKLALLRPALDVAKREEHRTRLYAFLRSRLTGEREQKVIELTQQLHEAIKAVHANDQEIIQALIDFSPELQIDASNAFGNRSVDLESRVEWMLRADLHIPIMGNPPKFAEPAVAGARVLRSLLTAVANISGTGGWAPEENPEIGDVILVAVRNVGYNGRVVKPGTRIRCSREEADAYIKNGSARELTPEMVQA